MSLMYRKALKMRFVAILVASMSIRICSCFCWHITNGQGRVLPRTSITTSIFSKKESTSDESKCKRSSVLFQRRSFLASALGSIVTPFVLEGLSGSQTASAEDNIFKPNPLTNPILEQIRIWEQAEADNIKYGGELEMGDAGNKGKVEAYPRLLVPILKIDEELKEVDRLVHENDRTKEAWSKALSILQQPTYEKITFKKTFNKYGDNIYYSDPDRANAYLGGGATPKTEQSLAYLLRNDLLTNIENLRAELDFLIKSDETDTEDLYRYSNVATSAMKKYLAIVPPNELTEAQKILGEFDSSIVRASSKTEALNS